MIQVTVYRQKGSWKGFLCAGHAESVPEDAYDPICDAVSILVINTVNAIETFCTEGIREVADEEEGRIELEILDAPSEKTDLLIDTMILGIQTIIDQYGDRFVSLEMKEE